MEDGVSPDSARAQAATEQATLDRASGWSWLATGWLVLVAAVLFHVPPLYWLVALLAAPVQVLAWLLLTFLVARRLIPIGVARRYVTAFGAAFIALGFMVINWSMWAPSLYFATHRYAFSDLAREFGVNGSSYNGATRLPFTSQFVSADGTATAAETESGAELYLVPEFYGLVDGATGFVLVIGDPDPNHIVDLYGDQARLGGGVDLGDGWWYLRPGDGLSRGVSGEVGTARSSSTALFDD